MKKIVTFIFLIIGLVYRASAQEQLTKKQLADKAFERYEYFKSLNLYLGSNYRHDIRAIERIADCYRLLNDYENAEVWYSNAIDYPNAKLTDTYYYAEALLRNKKTDEAKEQYKQYYAKTGDSNQLRFKLATCDSAASWMKQTSGFAIKNEQQLNTAYADWGLTYYGKTSFVFTSDRKADDDKKDTYNRTGSAYLKLYQTTGDSIFLLPVNTQGVSFITENLHTGPIAFNSAQDTAYITVTTTVPSKQLPLDKKVKGSTQSLYTRRLELMIATKTNNQWGNFKNFPYNNVKEYSVGQAALSKKGDILYFIADMPGGEGKTDIWYCVRQVDGSWGKPINCGKTINTKEDEAFPTINEEGVLYFSSNGLPGMGGFDIFRAKGEKETWAKPENLKYPVNSTSDDFCYITKDNLNGYFSSNREDGQGNDDIYSFSYNPPALIAAPPKKITQTAITDQPLKKGSTFVLNNIYYDLDKADIRPDAAVELDKLVQILKAHPTLRIEIGSHTDSRAPAAYNLKLSKRRAASAIAYLVKQGIATDRLIAKGYGDTRLLNNCVKGVVCTEAEHQLNRRTEVRVLGGE